MSKSALIVFLRKPELGKVKTRLAKDIGDGKALDIYKILINKTREESENLNVDIFPFYTPEIPNYIPWENSQPQVQNGKDLGECMSNAFEYLFQSGYDKIAIIGSDCYAISSEILNQAFENLDHKDYVIGPSEDGGYYLLGMKKFNPDLFQNIEWSESDVYDKTVDKISDKSVHVLKILNDIDNLEDLNKEPLLKNQVY